MANDLEVLYDAVKNGRVKLDELSDQGLNALKSYVYTKDKNFSSEQPAAARMTQQAMNPQKNVDFNYKDTSIPQAAFRGQMAADQAERNRNYSYPSAQPEMAKLQSENIRARYTGTPPKQANVGQSFRKDQPNYRALPNYPSITSPREKGFFEGIGDNISLAAKKVTESPQAFKAGIGELIGGVLSGVSVGITDSKLIPESLRDAEKTRKAILGRDSETIKTTGELIGMLAPYSAAYKVANKVIPKLPKLGKFATSAVRGALAGAGYQSGVEAVDQTVGRDEKSLVDSALNIGLATGIGAVADPLFLVAPEAIKALGRKAKEEVAGIAANLLSKIDVINQRDLSNVAASRYGGEKGLAKSLTGASNMKRYEKSILTEDQIREIRRRNADEVLREIADQQTKYLEKHQALSNTFNELPAWAKQRAMQVYNESVKNSPKIGDFSKEKLDAQYQIELDNLMSELNKYDQVFESVPMEYEMGLADYQNQIRTRGQINDDRQRTLNKLLGSQAKIDNYRIYKENALTEAFDQLPQVEKERLLKEYLERSKDLPKIEDMTLENKQAQYRQEVTPLFEQELKRQDMAFERQNRESMYANMFNDIQRTERQAELANTPDIRQFSQENIRKQNQQKFNELFGKLAEQESKRAENQTMYERLVEQRDNEMAIVQKQIDELDNAILEVENQIKSLDSQREKEILNITNSYWNEFKSGGKKSVVYDPIMEEVQRSGFMRVPSKESFYYEEYKKLPSTVKRKYFRDSNSALQIDEMSDALGISANDLLIKLRQGNSGVVINQVWMNDFIKTFGNKPTKANVEQFVRQQINSGDLPIDEILGFRESREGLESVLNYMKQDRAELIRNPVPQKNSSMIDLSNLPKAQEKNIQLPTASNTDSAFNQSILPKKKNDSVNVDSVKEAMRKNKIDSNNMIKAQEQQLNFMPNRIGSGINRSDVKSPDPEVERATTSTLTVPQTIKNQVIQIGKDLVDGTKNLYKSYFRYRDELKYDPKLQNGFRKAEGIPDESRNFAQENIEDIVSSLRDRAEFNVFRKILMLRDFEQEVLAGRKVPRNLTIDQIRNELDRLDRLATPAVKTAYQNHVRLMYAIGKELESRGKMAVDSTKNVYFPHRVLDYAENLERSTSPNPRSIKTPYRFYTFKRDGSPAEIESDYVKVMTNVLYRVGLDNKTDDFVRNIIATKDKSSEMQQLLNQNLMSPSVNKNGVVTFPDGTRYRNWQYNGENYMLDERIVNNLDQFLLIPNQSPLLRIGRGFTNWWKRITLDFAGLPFHFTNFLGDTLALYRDDPFALVDVKNITKSAKMLLRDKSKLTKDEQDLLDLARDERIFQSGMTYGLLGRAFPKQPVPNRFTPVAVKWLYWTNPFNIMESVSTTRESLPRMVKFLRDVDQIHKNKLVRTKLFNDSQLQNMKNSGMTDEEIAGIVNRDGFIDYGKLSPFARNELSGFLFPFFTFYHQNFKNWAKYIVKKPGDFALKFGLPASLMMLWNNVKFKEVEENLPDYIRDVPHFITGWTNENGQPFVLKFNTPMTAAEQFVALNKVPRQLIDSTFGDKNWEETVSTQTMDTLKAPFKVGFNLLNPLLSTSYEVFANKDTFTGSNITPERLVGTDEDIKRRAKFFVGNIFTPFGVYQQYDKSNLEPSEGFTEDAKGILYQQFLDPKRALGRYVDLSKNERNKQFQQSSEIDTLQKEAKFDVETAYIESVLKNNRKIFTTAMQKSGLTQDQIKPIVTAPRVQLEIVKQKLKSEKDPLVRAQLLDRKQKLEVLQTNLSRKSMPKSAQKQLLEGRQ